MKDKIKYKNEIQKESINEIKKNLIKTTSVNKFCVKK